MIHGAFVFRNEGDGCLTAKFMHDEKGGPFTESCVLTDLLNDRSLEISSGSFLGDYTCTWIGGTNKHLGNGILTIRKQPTNVALYELSWLNPKSQLIFSGTGMLFEKLLVGTYWEPALLKSNPINDQSSK
jgi:hypothetical protein